MSDKQVPPECTASISGICLRMTNNEGACDVEDGECVYGGRPGKSDVSDDFDGCYRKCRKQGGHTLEYGRCEQADKPEPTVSMSKVAVGPDGHPVISYDQYTVQALADLIEPALLEFRLRVGPNALAQLNRGQSITLSGGERWDIARLAAHAIVHRNDKETKP